MIVHTGPITLRVMWQHGLASRRPLRQAPRCNTATADDLLIPAPTDHLPAPPSQRPRFDDEDAPKRRPPKHQSARSRPAARRAPPLPASVPQDDIPDMLQQAATRIATFLTALQDATLEQGTALHELRDGMLGNDRPPATMRRSQLIHAAFVAGHALKARLDSLPPSMCRHAQIAAVQLLALGANAPHPPSYPQLRKLLASLAMGHGRLEGVDAALLSYTVLRTLATETDIVPLAKALDVWQGVGVITHADQEDFANLLAPKVAALRSRVASGLAPAAASDICEAAAQCFAVWSRVRYLPVSLDMHDWMELITHAVPHGSAWQVAMILRNATNAGTWGD